MAWYVIQASSTGRKYLSVGKSRRNALETLVGIDVYCFTDAFMVHSRTGERIKAEDAFDELFPKRIARPVPRALIMLNWAIIAVTLVSIVLILMKLAADAGAGR